MPVGVMRVTSEVSISPFISDDEPVASGLESGKELFLSVTTRQKLARALKLQPIEIKSYEKVINDISVKQETIDDLKEMILEGEEDLYCPICGSKLVIRVAKMYDLEDNPVYHPKAHCSQCTFQIK